MMALDLRLNLDDDWQIKSVNQIWKAYTTLY